MGHEQTATPHHGSRAQAWLAAGAVDRGIDVAAAKQAEKALVLEVPTVERLGQVWLARYIQPRYKHPEVVARVLRKHINPVIGTVAPPDVHPIHVDRVLTRIVAGGAPTVADDALRDKVVRRRRYADGFKARVLAECDAPGASVAKVAMAHGINANVVHRWRQLACEDGQSTAAIPSEFVPVSIAAPTQQPVQACRDIEVDVRRGAVTMKVIWPSSAAGDFAAWTRELLR